MAKKRIKRNEPKPIEWLATDEDYWELETASPCRWAASLMCGITNIDGLNLVDACRGNQPPWHWALGMLEQALKQLRLEGWTIVPPEKEGAKK